MISNSSIPQRIAHYQTFLTCLHIKIVKISTDINYFSEKKNIIVPKVSLKRGKNIIVIIPNNSQQDPVSIKKLRWLSRRFSWILRFQLVDQLQDLGPDLRRRPQTKICPV